MFGLYPTINDGLRILKPDFVSFTKSSPRNFVSPYNIVGFIAANEEM